MANRDVLAIGASAGGIEALRFLAERLPADIPAVVLVTQHLSPHFKSSLDDILGRAGPLPARFASDGEPAKRGTIYLAPPDRHLLIHDNELWLGSGPRENNSRPAVDPMLRSAATCCGSRTVAVVLTGTLGDGASGLWSVDQCGGTTVVQDPKDAAFPEMPLNALQRIEPRYVAPLAEMPALLQKLVREPAGDPVPAPSRTAMEVSIARGGHMPIDEMDRIGRRSVFACPECHGVMWEIDEGNLTRFRCHVGHSYTAELMSLALEDSLRRALATALRSLEERVELAHNLQRQAEALQHTQAAATWSDRVADFRKELDIIEGAVQRMDEIAAMIAQHGGKS